MPKRAARLPSSQTSKNEMSPRSLAGATLEPGHPSSLPGRQDVSFVCSLHSVFSYTWSLSELHVPPAARRLSRICPQRSLAGATLEPGLLSSLPCRQALHWLEPYCNSACTSAQAARPPSSQTPENDMSPEELGRRYPGAWASLKCLLCRQAHLPKPVHARMRSKCDCLDPMLSGLSI